MTYIVDMKPKVPDENTRKRFPVQRLISNSVSPLHRWSSWPIKNEDICRWVLKIHSEFREEYVQGAASELTVNTSGQRRTSTLSH